MGQSVLISRVNTLEKLMALTFDDGSSSGNTQKILNVLSAYGVKSTFFLTGQSIDSHPDAVKLILQNGHEIGNHSYSHPEFTKISADAMITEIRRCENSLMNAAGISPKPLFRPPYGSYNTTVLNVVGSAGYPYTIYWTIDTIDWNGTSASTMINNVLSNAKPGAIVLMHVGGTYTAEALPTMIQGLRDRGYTMTTISKILSSAGQSGSHPLLKIGSTGEAVKELQLRLAGFGFSPGPIDGIFGPKTDAAVRAFQSSRGLVVDGIVGPQTWAALDNGSSNPPSPPPSGHPLLRNGSTGDAVRYLQQKLSDLGFNPGPIDGIFGPKTEAAVRTFQSSRGLVVDGIVGPQTWAALDNA